MRTDLLTGDLAFLRRRWAGPAPSQRTLCGALSTNGVVTHLVTDNYVAVLPQLGGDLRHHFDQTIFLRGTGADPWRVVEASDHAMVRARTRSAAMESQFVANARWWLHRPVSSEQLLFDQAAHALTQMMGSEDRFLLLIDCFASHEPWVEPAELFESFATRTDPVLPPYGAAFLYASMELARMRASYARRIGRISRALVPFAELLRDAVRSGEVALAVLSDHGFAFGEFGLVGKAANDPVVRPHHDIVFRLSPQFFYGQSLASLPRQPHHLTNALARLFNVSFNSLPFAPPETGGLQLIGRNGPAVPTITVATENGAALVFRDELGLRPKWLGWNREPEEDCWRNQPEYVPRRALPEMEAVWSEMPRSTWLEGFRRGLESLVNE